MRVVFNGTVIEVESHFTYDETIQEILTLFALDMQNDSAYLMYYFLPEIGGEKVTDETMRRSFEGLPKNWKAEAYQTLVEFNAWFYQIRQGNIVIDTRCF